MSYRVTHSPETGNLLCDADGCHREAMRLGQIADFDQSKPMPMRATAIGRGIYCDECEPRGPYAVSVIWQGRGPWRTRPR